MKKNMLMSAAKKARVLLAVMAVCGMSFVGAGEIYAENLDIPDGKNMFFADDCIAGGKYNQMAGNHSVAFGNNNVTRGEYSGAIGYWAVASGENSFAIGYMSEATEKDTVSFGSYSATTGENHNKRLVNLLDGKDDWDAATVGQVKTMIAQAGGGSVDLTGLNEDLKPKDGSDATVVSALNTVDDKVNTNAENIEKNKEAIQQNKDAIDNNSTAIQKNTTDIAANKEAIAKISTASQSVGDINDLDSDIKADTTVGAINNVNSKVDMLGNRVDKLDSKINKVGAGAAALAALHPMDFDPDNKLTFAAGIGNYQGENAMALGAFYRPDEKVMFSIAGNMGNGENMINAGITFALDRTHSTTTSKAAMAKKIEEQANDIAQLKAMVAELSAKVK